MTAARRASALLLLVSGALLAGAFAFQYIGGLAPCEMCWWQRWAHMAVLGAAVLALLTGNRALALLAILAMVASAGLGLFHAGVEQDWWEGITACTAPAASGLSQAELLDTLMNAPLTRCDEIPWSLSGLSMAGWNAVISAAAALAALWLWRKA
jgi:disulfide bond formation protein DsbB